MLFAASQTEFAGARLRSTLCFDRRLRLHVVGKERLLFDSRYAPPCPVARDVVSLYLVLRGTMATATGTWTGPAGWILAETELERIVAGVPWFRCGGERSLTVDVRLARAAVRAPVGLAAGPRALGDATVAAVEVLAGFPADTAPAVALAAVHALQAALVADGILVAPVALTEVEAPSMIRLWQALTPAYDAYATGVTIDQLAAASGRSSRQVRRELKQLAIDFDLFGGNFRHITRILRLRAALLLLSAPDASVADVAERVGYGSPVAMARAFRDAALPPPSDVRALVRFAG